MQENDKKRLTYKQYKKGSKTRVNMSFTNEFAESLKSVCNELDVTVSGYVEDNMKKKVAKDQKRLNEQNEKGE